MQLCRTDSLPLFQRRNAVRDDGGDELLYSTACSQCQLLSRHVGKMVKTHNTATIEGNGCAMQPVSSSTLLLSFSV